MIEPYGGRLVAREVSDAERARRDAELGDLLSGTPPIDQAYGGEKIGIGG